MSSGTVTKQLPEHEQRHVVDLLMLGPIEHPDDGTVECRACERRLPRARYGVHRYASHVRYLDRRHALMLPGMVGCDTCDETLLATSIGKHRRDVHGIRGGNSGQVRTKRGRPTSAEVERAIVRRNGHASPTLPTPTDAGLAILAGLAPGGSVPVERLHEVVEWLATAEHLVASIRPNTT